MEIELAGGCDCLVSGLNVGNGGSTNLLFVNVSVEPGAEECGRSVDWSNEKLCGSVPSFSMLVEDNDMLADDRDGMVCIRLVVWSEGDSCGTGGSALFFNMLVELLVEDGVICT